MDNNNVRITIIDGASLKVNQSVPDEDDNPRDTVEPKHNNVERQNYSTMSDGHSLDENGIISFRRTECGTKVRTACNILTSSICIVITWAIMYMIFDHNKMAGSQLASVALLVTSSWVGGKIAEQLYMPSMMGMLMAGVLLSNFGYYDVNNSFQIYIIILREIALTVLLVASGLSLDSAMLRKLSLVVVQLAILPCITETLAAAVVTHYLIGLPWIWGILLGCILSPVSSAVILPTLLSLKQKGLGEDKGIITLVMAACSFDDIFCISAFGVCLSIIFSTSSWELNVMQGPLEVLIGLFCGIIWGVVVGFIPHKCEENLNVKRAYIAVGGGILLMFGCTIIGYSGAGPLAAMTAAFVANICWKNNNSYNENVENIVNKTWDMLEPILFASIGTEINLANLKSSLLISASILLIITSLVRVLTCFFVLRDTNFNLREKFFVNIAWLPKATVQAAIGPIALDMARRNHNVDQVNYASDVLAISVLAIIITAPVGAISMTLLGDYLLRKQY
ncbi:sodium/hydrogen exchanger 9B2-like isoform X2 [Adelges cooleyi]|uniref:sodium/hydrogen exchanger 9B2-like isoform X2 n=1 Tax=Adelges cooleyi TaxID=133065 RepID=UPI00218015D3|nr:sodium/hydrogen exchanger 9B2-like isoform X2 [Adelges cooleyi]